MKRKAAKMKPVMAWAIVDRDTGAMAFSPWDLRKHAVGGLCLLCAADRQRYRIARVKITELKP